MSTEPFPRGLSPMLASPGPLPLGDGWRYEIKWDENIATSEDRCVKLSVEQPMSWVGNFTTHPMKAAGGATPNPFDLVKDNVSNGGSEQESSAVSFQTPGTYGYICGVHPSMTGAVLVVPAAVQ